MINTSNRVPGQLVPVCSPWNGNAGLTLTPPATSGLGIHDCNHNPDGLGKFDLLSLSPMVQAYRRAQAEQAAHGLGQTGVGTLIGGALVLYALTYGTLGYFAGKAMAPSKQNEKGYATAGVLLAIFGGVVGLGAEGIYASTKK